MSYARLGVKVTKRKKELKSQRRREKQHTGQSDRTSMKEKKTGRHDGREGRTRERDTRRENLEGRQLTERDD